jgi:hypothetical protein
LPAAFRHVTQALADARSGSLRQSSTQDSLEVAVLDRSRPQARKFRRVTDVELQELRGD